MAQTRFNLDWSSIRDCQDGINASDGGGDSYSESDEEYDNENFAYLCGEGRSAQREYTAEEYNGESSVESKYEPDKVQVDLSGFPVVPALYNDVQSTSNFRDRLEGYTLELTPSEAAFKRTKRKQGGFPLYGPRSLGEMALAVLAMNADKLNTRHVEGLSDAKRTLLKKTITRNADLSVKLWKILLPRQERLLPGDAATPPTPLVISKSADGTATGSAAGPVKARLLLAQAEKRPHMFCSQVRHPRKEIGPYIQSLTAPSMDFIAHVRIHACGKSFFDYNELIKLAKMPNLGILEIIEINHPEIAASRGIKFDPPVRMIDTGGMDSHQSSQVNDKLFIGWCSAKPVPFPELRVLRLWGCMSQSLTQRCLEYSAAFPKLAHFELSVDRLFIDDERSIQPGPGFEDGPRGAWKQTSAYMGRYGWRGFRSNRSLFSYGDVTCRSPVQTKKENSKLSLNMVEPNSIPRCAMEWGGRVYSYTAQKGYREKNDDDYVIDVIRSLGQVDQCPIVYNIASMTFGVDRHVKSRRAEDLPWNTYTMTFIRTSERVQTQADANQRFRDEQAWTKARKATERRAQTKAQRDAAKATKESGHLKPLVMSARAKKRAAADPLVPGWTKRNPGTRENLGFTKPGEVLANLE